MNLKKISELERLESLNDESNVIVEDGGFAKRIPASKVFKPDANDYVTPEMFGAAGDGVEDDTEAVQACVNSGKKVLLLNKYTIKKSIIIHALTDNGVEIYGNPGSSITLDSTAENDCVFKLTNTSQKSGAANYRIRIIGVNAFAVNGKKQNFLKYETNDESTKVFELYVEKCNVKVSGYAISLTEMGNVYRPVIRDCYFECGGAMIASPDKFSSSVTSGMIIDNIRIYIIQNTLLGPIFDLHGCTATYMSNIQILGWAKTFDLDEAFEKDEDGNFILDDLGNKVPRFARDENGNFILDANDDKIPQYDLVERKIINTKSGDIDYRVNLKNKGRYAHFLNCGGTKIDRYYAHGVIDEKNSFYYEYEKDKDGKFILDEDGNKIHQMVPDKNGDLTEKKVPEDKFDGFDFSFHNGKAAVSYYNCYGITQCSARMYVGESDKEYVEDASKTHKVVLFLRECKFEIAGWFDVDDVSEVDLEESSFTSKPQCKPILDNTLSPNIHTRSNYVPYERLPDRNTTATSIDSINKEIDSIISIQEQLIKATTVSFTVNGEECRTIAETAWKDWISSGFNTMEIIAIEQRPAIANVGFIHQTNTGSDTVDTPNVNESIVTGGKYRTAFTFKVGAATREGAPGLTWAEWCEDTKNNTISATIEEGYVKATVSGTTGYVVLDGVYQLADTVMVLNGKYTLVDSIE